MKRWREPLFEPWMFGLTAATSVWLILAALVRVAAASAEDEMDAPDVVHEGLDAAVSTMHTMLAEWCSKRQCGTDLRTTFHRVVPPVHEPQAIEQIINYAGSGGEGMGRTFPVHTGIAGRAVRSKTPLVMSSQHRIEDQLRAELVHEWGYTAAQARRLGPGRYSAMAVPVLDRSGQHPIGVLYLDSRDRSLFERGDVSEIVGAGAKAISDFVTKRY